MLKILFKNRKHFTGILGEFIAIIYYFFIFSRLLHWRYKSKFGEIDLILRNKNTIIFCEVKTRLNMKIDMNNIENLISKTQLKRLKNSMQNFMNKHRRYKTFNYRFDVIVVSSFFKIPLHIKNMYI